MTTHEREPATTVDAAPAAHEKATEDGNPLVNIDSPDEVLVAIAKRREDLAATTAAVERIRESIVRANKAVLQCFQGSCLDEYKLHRLSSDAPITELGIDWTALADEWVSKCWVPAAVAIRRMEQELGISFRQVVREAPRAGLLAFRRIAHETIRDLFLPLYESPADPEMIVLTKRRVRAVIQVNPGGMLVNCEWFDVLNYRLINALGAIDRIHNPDASAVRVAIESVWGTRSEEDPGPCSKPLQVAIAASTEVPDATPASMLAEVAVDSELSGAPPGADIPRSESPAQAGARTSSRQRSPASRRIDHIDLAILRRFAAEGINQDDDRVWKRTHVARVVPNLSTEAAKSRCSKLVKFGHLGSRLGTGGGCWITQSGLAYVHAHADGASAPSSSAQGDHS